MWLIEKSGKRRPICRICRKLHGPMECPKRLSGGSDARFPAYPKPVTMRTLRLRGEA